MRHHVITGTRSTPARRNPDRSPAADAVTYRIDDPALTVRTDRGYLVAAVSGALDSSHAPALREQLLRVLRPDNSQLVIDLSLVSRIDAGGLALLVGTERRARLLGGSLRLAAATPAVASALRVAGLDRLLRIFPTVQSAVILSE